MNWILYRTDKQRWIVVFLVAEKISIIEDKFCNINDCYNSDDDMNRTKCGINISKQNKRQQKQAQTNSS